MNKKIAIIIGDFPDHFVNNLRFFENLEREIGCIVKKKTKSRFESKINNNKVIFQFCIGPSRDPLWLKRKGSMQGLPPTIEDFSKMKLDLDEIYYLGYCGVFKGKKDSIYLPTRFSKVTFEDYILDHNHIIDFDVEEKLTYENSLIDRIKGKKCSAITVNQILSLKYVKDNSLKILNSISKEMAKHADIVEMESYEIVKLFRNKYPLGLFYYGMDYPNRKRNVAGSGKVVWNKEKFTKAGIGMIKTVVGVKNE